jgi:hypothetical protein
LEKTGDNWEPKGPQLPERPGWRRPQEHGRYVDANGSTDYLMDVPKKLDIRRRSRISKADLIDAIQKANAVLTQKACGK